MIPAVSRVLRSLACVALLGAAACASPEIRFRVADRDGAPVPDTHISGWSIPRAHVEALLAAGRTEAEIADDREVDRERFDRVSADGEATIALAEELGLVWFQAWLPRRGWPGFRLASAIRLPLSREPHVLGMRVEADGDTLTVWLTVEPDPRGVTVDPPGTLPRISWPPLRRSIALPREGLPPELPDDSAETPASPEVEPVDRDRP